jgi:hypothetical protein
MRRLLAALALVAGLAAGPLAAQERPADVSPADRAAIEGVIARQIEAFLRDDGDAAFAFASPGIQGLFMTPERFMAMVRGGYRPVYRPREYRFARLSYVGDALVQFVAIIGPDGAPVIAAYYMEQQADGSWRIAGCELLVAPGEST